MRYVLFSLLLATSTANAANWVEIAKLDSKGSVLQIDTLGIAKVSGLRKAWFKYVYTSDQPIPEGYGKAATGVRFYRSDLSLMYFNCTERTLAVSQSILSSTGAAVVGNFDISQGLLSYREVPPETIGERMFETVCGWDFLGDSPIQPAAPTKPGGTKPALTPAELRERN
jgi:hypothetical protein